MTTMAALVIAGVLTGTPTSPQADSDSRWGKSVTYEATDRVDVTSDIVYARYGDRTLRLDLYLPHDRSRPTIPGIIVIHGGGWRQGDKERSASIASRLADAGFAAASVEYRLSPEAPFPAAVHDVKAATRWMRANAEKYGIAGEALGAIGGSAGAHLAILLATSHGVTDLEGSGGHGDFSSKIQAAVGMATPATFVDFDGWGFGAVEAFLAVSPDDQPRTWTLASPVSHVDPTDPPIQLLHSDSDGVVPYKQSFDLAGHYEEAGLTSELITIPGGPHAFWNFETWFGDIMEKAITFFNAQLVATPPAGHIADVPE